MVRGGAFSRGERRVEDHPRTPVENEPIQTEVAAEPVSGPKDSQIEEQPAPDQEEPEAAVRKPAGRRGRKRASVKFEKTTTVKLTASNYKQLMYAGVDHDLEIRAIINGLIEWGIKEKRFDFEYADKYMKKQS